MSLKMEADEALTRLQLEKKVLERLEKEFWDFPRITMDYQSKQASIHVVLEEDEMGFADKAVRIDLPHNKEHDIVVSDQRNKDTNFHNEGFSRDELEEMINHVQLITSHYCGDSMKPYAKKEDRCFNCLRRIDDEVKAGNQTYCSEKCKREQLDEALEDADSMNIAEVSQ